MIMEKEMTLNETVLSIKGLKKKFGDLEVLRGLDLDVRDGEQIAIIGHDGLDMIKMVHPQITTIEQPRYEMGKLAAEILIEQIEQGTAPRSITLQPRLLIGETT